MGHWQELKDEMQHLIEHVMDAEKPLAAILEKMAPEMRASKLNLIHYLALRQCDVRPLQLRLSAVGLSSLNSCEGRVLSHLQSVHARLTEAAAADSAAGGAVTDAEARAVLHHNTQRLFGTKPLDRHVYIMVTAPSAAAADAAWFDQNIKAGMNLLRINTAHGDPDEWRRLAAASQDAAKRTGAALKILVDLPGPKLRTSNNSTLEVLKLKPERDELGRTQEPCRVALVAASAAVPGAMVVPPEVLAVMQVDDILRFKDTRGKKRVMHIVAKTADGVTGSVAKTAFISPETLFAHVAANGTKHEAFQVSHLPSVQASFRVPLGGSFVLARRPHHEPHKVVMGCTLDAVFAAAKPGHRLLLDDGKIEACVIEAGPDRLKARIERAQKGSAKLRGDMGINLPDSRLDLPALNTHDEAALAFAEAEAAMVGLSFIRSAADVADVVARLQRPDLGLVVKIETQAGFQALPEILLKSLKERPAAVMIARGDLAAECGFERLAELQEEILWLCEAAHVPVIWATQVLETLAKTGVPTRAEVTDAAMSVRAECVMLNKGPHISEAITALASILRRMESHSYKKRQLYRPLAVSKQDMFSS